ncbi:uncharacterized protein BT62DRAFT_732613 [Guyanagaster necrorhizus]|uniref:Uncharacterized protein n=1 Tax=Guyanagaster necrorhizus TaxID=856835 RepID=A0A9P8AUW4_9AGAR|nr:uncharacterized protein BT62DRAFT_732613 [Guyanagaster necrorhizus MCA 3950]KAG7448893.1 hypothetical protein BT62DRAFT_732613 [Guyanagaster necrorhizus MCA 3950]
MGFLVLRSSGLHLLRPEKSWRPIITIQVESKGGSVDCDATPCHETTLGSDGQNPNQKEVFYIHDVSLQSKISIKVWHRSQSKRKGRKKILVANACYMLGDLIKGQNEAGQCLDVRLNTLSSNTKRLKGARLGVWPKLSLRVRLPSTAKLHYEEQPSDDDSLSCCSDSIPSTPRSEGHDDAIILPPPTEQELKRRLQPYMIDSDDEMAPLLTDEAYLNSAPPILPQYSETEKPPDLPAMGVMQRIVASFTMYAELRDESHYERAFSRQQMEWSYVGGLLTALAAVDTAVFSISPGSLFIINPIAQSFIAMSSTACGLGIFCDAWFIFRYNFVPLETARTRSRDMFDSYFFFSLSARVPIICMLLSGLTLMGFLGVVAWTVWPAGLLIMSFVVGMLMSLQFLVFGAWWFVGKVMCAGRKVRKVIKWVVGRDSGEETSNSA